MSSGANILWLVAAVVIVLWLIGIITSFLGGLIHLLLVIAAIIIVYNLLTGRKTL